MRWKEILVGAAVTLVVTVIGGLLVYKFTQTPNKNEILSYEIDKQVAFEGVSNKISIGSAKMANIGGQPAKDVIATLKVADSSFLEVKAISNIGGDITSKITDNKSVTITTKNLLPGEIISATYLLSKESKIEAQLRSENSIGKAGQIYKAEGTKKDKINKFLGDFVPLLIVVAFLPIIFILRYLRRGFSRGSCKNNTGFVFLHTGMNDEATEILKAAVNSGQDGCHAISNYALCLALNGKNEDAIKNIKAAEFLAKGDHEHAVVHFNAAIIDFLNGDNTASVERLKKAIKLSKKEILMYCRNSVHVQDMISKCNELKLLIEGA